MSSSALRVVLAPPSADGSTMVLSGELDGAGAARLRGQLEGAVAPGERLALDLSGVTRLGAEALGALVHAHRRQRDGGGALVLSAVSAPVLRALRTSGLHRVLALEVLLPEQAPLERPVGTPAPTLPVAR